MVARTHRVRAARKRDKDGGVAAREEAKQRNLERLAQATAILELDAWLRTGKDFSAPGEDHAGKSGVPDLVPGWLLKELATCLPEPFCYGRVFGVELQRGPGRPEDAGAPVGFLRLARATDDRGPYAKNSRRKFHSVLVFMPLLFRARALHQLRHVSTR
jgi:hypothetical protein